MRRKLTQRQGIQRVRFLRIQQNNRPDMLERMLPPKAIQEFKELYRKHFGEDLSDAEAERGAEKFLDLFRAVYRPRFSLDSTLDKPPQERMRKSEKEIAGR